LTASSIENLSTEAAYLAVQVCYDNYPSAFQMYCACIDGKMAKLEELAIKS
jgi:hypothetical protein